MSKKGLLLVISAPSGAGKTTLCKALLKYMPNLYFSVSVTTRKPRLREVNGKDYFFITEKEFRRKIHQNELIEWAKVHNHWYGTPKKFVQESLLKGQDVILDIDVQGGIKVKKIYHKSVLIFVIPPSIDVLEKRIRKRGMDDEDEIKKRLKNTHQEMKKMREYDYVTVNDKISKAIEHIENIINNEKIKQ